MRSRLVNNVAFAFRQNVLPGMFLWVFAISLCLSYYYWPAAKPVFDFFADLKQEWGWRYAMISTSLFGGVIPCTYLYLSGKIKTHPVKYVLFLSVFWAYKGVEVDMLYTLQTYIFGDGKDMATVMKKTLVDQFVYGPLWAVPTMSIGMLYPECNFNFSRFKKRFDRDLFFLKMPTILISNMMVWIPTVTVVYLMPFPLQIPVSNLALCFFVLILAVLAGDSSEKKAG